MLGTLKFNNSSGFFISFLTYQADSAVPAQDEGARTLPQVVEITGSESPSTVSWDSSRNTHRVRHDLSRARLRALESSLENGQLWVPSSPSHRKTWEEEVKFC